MKNETLQLIKYEYIKLKEKNNLTNNQIINTIILKALRYIYEDETNDIYIYLGNYDENSKLYKNIELDYDFKVPNSDRRKFESEHIIIRPKNDCYQKTYNDVQKDFFKKAIRSNQEEAKKLVIKKYKKRDY